jgi:hypothetical protein
MMFKQLNPNHCLRYLIGADNSRQVAIVDPVLQHLKLAGGMVAWNRSKVRKTSLGIEVGLP